MTYEPLWKTLKDRNMTKYKLVKEYSISTGQISRLTANKPVSTHTVEMLCSILHCNVQDIMQYKKEP